MEALTCPKCNFLREPRAVDCPACGIVFAKYQKAAPPPAARPSLNPYAAPQSDLAPPPPLPAAPPRAANANDSAWRQGSLLVLRQKEAKLPDRCVCCNRPTTFRWETRFSWNPYRQLTRVIGLFALLFTRWAKVAVPLCGEHEAKRRHDLKIAMGLILAGVALLAGTLLLDSDTKPFFFVLIFGLALAATGLFFLLSGASPLSVVRIKDGYIWLNKADADFLDALPEAPSF